MRSKSSCTGGQRALVFGLCALMAGFAAPSSSDASLLDKAKRTFEATVPTNILPSRVIDVFARANQFFAVIDATVTSTKYQFNEAVVSKDRALALGNDLSGLLHGDWSSVLGGDAADGAEAGEPDPDLPALVATAASDRSTVTWATDQGDPLEAAVERWLASRIPGGEAEKLVLTRNRTESAAKFRSRVAAAQAELDRKLSNAGDMARVLTITGLPITVAKPEGDRLPVSVRLGLMSLTPNGLYGFDFDGLKEKQCTEFVSAGEGVTFLVCGKGDSYESLAKLVKAPEFEPVTLYAEVDVTIAAMSEMMPRAHDAMLRAVRASLEASTDPRSASLLALPAVHVRALRIKSGAKTLLVRQPYFIKELLAGGDALVSDSN